MSRTYLYDEYSSRLVAVNIDAQAQSDHVVLHRRGGVATPQLRFGNISVMQNPDVQGVMDETLPMKTPPLGQCPYEHLM
jgi:hypothetical protein